MAVQQPASIRIDQKVIAGMVTPGSRVLEIGCHEGALLEYLTNIRNVRGHGMELSAAGVSACLQKGLSVIQGDADHDLVDYPDNAFDCAILSRTIQATHAPHKVLEQLARISQKIIISFPNFAYWRVRLQLLIGGKMPVNAFLSHEWYDTPNIHLCTIKDFIILAESQGLRITKLVPIKNNGHAFPSFIPVGLSNWLAEQAIFCLEK